MSKASDFADHVRGHEPQDLCFDCGEDGYFHIGVLTTGRPYISLKTEGFKFTESEILSLRDWITEHYDG